jgi:hypothetical protein
MKREIGLLIGLVFILLLVACNSGGLEPPAASDETEPFAGEGPEATPSVEPTEAADDVSGDDVSGDDVSADDEASENYENLTEALQTAGLDVESAGDIEDPFFDVETQLLTAGDTRIEVFQFQDEAAAEEAAATINPSGTIIDTTTVDWLEPPHFYRHGRLLVLYAGSDEVVLSVLGDVLGEPFVIGQTMGPPAAGSEASPTAES